MVVHSNDWGNYIKHSVSHALYSCARQEARARVVPQSFKRIPTAEGRHGKKTIQTENLFRYGYRIYSGVGLKGRID